MFRNPIPNSIPRIYYQIWLDNAKDGCSSAEVLWDYAQSKGSVSCFKFD